MKKTYNEMLIRNIDCGLLYFQIKDDKAIKEYEKLKKEKFELEHNKPDNQEKFMQLQKKMEELSNIIYSFDRNIKLSDKNNRFYYSGTITDSLMALKLRQITEDRDEINKRIKRIGNSDYTDLIINLKFKSDIMIPDDTPKRGYNPETDSIVEIDGKKMKRLITKKKLRQMAYKDGITINGIHYVNFQRTASKARTGNCLFIDEKYFDEMNEWQNLGIPFWKLKKADIVSIRSYQSLTSSSIIGELNIDPYSILLIDDVAGQATIDCNVVKSFSSESGRGNEVRVIREPYTQKTDLWDGQSLLDYSVFKNNTYATKDKDGTIKECSYQNYGFMLLRNHFFKSAAFNTNLQEYYQERFKDVENPVLVDAFGNKFSPENIRMVTTRNSVKIFKFSNIICNYMIEDSKKKHLEELQRLLNKKKEELRKINQAIIVAKRKLTMQLKNKSSIVEDINVAQNNLNEAQNIYDRNYQKLEQQIQELAVPIKLEQERLTWDWYREKIKSQDFGVCKTEHESKFIDKQQLWYQVINTLNFNKDELYELVKPQIDEINLAKSHVSFFKHFIGTKTSNKVEDSMMVELLNINDDISRTKWFTNYRRSRLQGIVKNLKAGKILIPNADFCVLFGNPYEMLRASCGDKIESSVLKDFECYCSKFKDGEKLFGMRAPHICTGNNALLTNTYCEVWKWFNLTNNILIINLWGKGAFLSPKWNGCDVDSDTAFIGNNPTILEKVKQVQDYLIPINDVPQKAKLYDFNNENMAKVDAKLANDLIGQICNLARDLQSLYWHLYNTGTQENKQKYLPMIYDDLCMFETLSNIAIDSTKRQYDCDIKLETKKIQSRPYMKAEGAIIKEESVIFVELYYKNCLSENKIKQYNLLMEKKNNVTNQDEINSEINKILMVNKEYMIRPQFTKKLKSQPKKKRHIKYENKEEKQLQKQKQMAYVQEQKRLDEKIYCKLQSPMDILGEIIDENIKRCPRTKYIPCFVDILKPIPSGAKADYNRINAIKELCLEANSKINCARSKYRDGKLSYDEMCEEIDVIEKDIVSNIKEREITSYDINVLIRKVYDVRPKREKHHGKIITDEKGKYIYIDKRDQDLIKAKAGGLLLKYLYSSHKDEFIKAIKESGKGTVSYIRKYEPSKNNANNKELSLKDVTVPKNEIIVLNGMKYEIITRKAE